MSTLARLGFYCWFARDVAAAMLVVKNKSISLLWEQTFLGTKLYFHVNSSRKIILFWPSTWPPCHVVANQKWESVDSAKCRPHWRPLGQVVFRKNARAFLRDKESCPRTVRKNEVSVLSQRPQSGFACTLSCHCLFESCFRGYNLKLSCQCLTYEDCDCLY